MLKLGTAKLVINPQVPVRMVGYATRTGPYDDVWQDIHTRVYSLRQDDTHILLVYADILWWNSSFVADARPRLSAAFGISEEQVLFVASHNHSGPGTGDTFTPLLETVDPNYAAYLYGRVEEASRMAVENEEKVTVTLHKDSCHLNVYRRVMTENGIAMWPNYNVPADDHLTVLRFAREDGSPKGLLLHYPCHANLSNGNALHPDYPGVAMDMLDEEIPGCTAMFFQGCTGDLRPNSVLGELFVPQSFEGVKNFANQFKKHCLAALAQPGETVEGKLQVKRNDVVLPVDPSKNDEKKAAAAAGDLASQQWVEVCARKDFRDHEILELSLLELGDFSMFFFNAEVSQHYAAFARELRPNAITSGYTNGMIGYLANATQIGEGGYEPEGSALYFAVAGTYPVSTQETIEKGLLALTK
jgi:hypothetical protein